MNKQFWDRHGLNKKTQNVITCRYMGIVILHTVYCKSFEVEKFRGFRGLTGDRETFPVKDFPTGNFLKNGRRHYTGERGIAIPIQLHECCSGFNSYGLPLITFRVSSAMTRAANRRRQVTFILIVQ